MENFLVYFDDMVQKWPHSISQEASQYFLKYEVGDILDEFWMSSMWDIWIFSYHKEDEYIDSNIFTTTLGLG